MMKNVGKLDRVVRALGATALLACAFAAPWPAHLRVPAFALPAAYLLYTALAGTCLGYRMMGRSTCAIEARR